MKSLTVNRAAVSDSGRCFLGAVLPNLDTCPFIRKMLRRMGYQGDYLRSEVRHLVEDVEVLLWDKEVWMTDPPGLIFVPRPDFLGGGMDDEEVAATFIHEIFHVIDGTYPDDFEYFENRIEVEAVREEVAYLRYLGREEAWIEEYLLRAHLGAEDRLGELMLPPDE